MEAQDILYETLSPLAATGPGSPTTTPPRQTVSSSVFEPYVVFRNEISLVSAQCPSPESAASDFFSLEVIDTKEDNDVSANATPQRPPPTPEVSTPVQERTLEGSWFHDSRIRSPMLRLHKEIVEFCDFLSPTPEEEESRNAAIKSVFDVINYIWPAAKAEIFGSYKTGLYLPSSDIDVVILNTYVGSPKIGLQALSRALSQKGIAKKIQVIAKARVPIIKFVEKKSGFAFDISFDAHNGPKAAEFIKDAVDKKPPLRPLCLILKVFLQQRELNEVYTGGIGSYALLVMLMTMLRQETQASPEYNLGMLLVKFFDMYGRKLNTADVGISCSGGGIFFPKSSKGFSAEGRTSLIAIEDPQAPENDIGKSSFNYYRVKSAFARAFTTLTNGAILQQLGPNKSILGVIIRPDAVLLERKGGSTGKMTFNNLFPGAGEQSQLLFSDQQMYCNWQLNDENEEPLPCGKGPAADADADAKSSGKKRKVTNENKSVKKVKGAGKGKEALVQGNGTPAKSDAKSSGIKKKGSKENKSAKKAKGPGNQENGVVVENGTKKQRWKNHQSGGYGAGPSSR